MTPIGPIDSLKVPRFAGFRTFARLPMISEVPHADVAVLGAPFDGTTTFRPGARYGPAAIREASLLLRPYNEPMGIAPFDLVQVVDAGDAPAGAIDVEQAHTAIFEAAAELHRADATVLGLGGDHSVALPLVRAAAERHGRMSLLQFDSHTDTGDSFYGARITHGTMFRRALEDGLIDPATSVQIGLRGPHYSVDDYPDNARLGFNMLLARELESYGVTGAIEFALDHLVAPVYLSLDIDCLDPAFAPGTGTPEAGGLTSRELLAILRGLAGRVEVAAADLVEVAPVYDLAGVTATTAAALAYDLVSLLSLSRAEATQAPTRAAEA